MENRSRTVIPSTFVIDTCFKLFCCVERGRDQSDLWKNSRGTGMYRKKKKKEKEKEKMTEFRYALPDISLRRAEPPLDIITRSMMISR